MDMDSRPTKRQRTLDLSSPSSVSVSSISSDDETDSWSENDNTLSMLPLRTVSAATDNRISSLRNNTSRPGDSSSKSKSTSKSKRPKTDSAPSSRKSKAQNTLRAPSSRTTSSTEKGQKVKGQSLHSYFQSATEEQRWSSRDTESKQSLEAGSVDDLIEDDYDSYDILSQHSLNLGGKDKSKAGSDRGSRSQTRNSKKSTATCSSKPFVLSSGLSHTESNHDNRPWAQRYGPSNVDELAVNKRKISDVGKWIEDVFTGRNKRVCGLLKFPMVK